MARLSMAGQGQLRGVIAKHAPGFQGKSERLNGQYTCRQKMAEMSALDTMVQWRDRIEEVQLAAEAALQEIDSVLDVVRAAAAGEPLTKRQRCDVLSNLGVVDNLYDTLVCGDLGEATRAIAEAVESAVPASDGGVGGNEGPNSPCADGGGRERGPK